MRTRRWLILFLIVSSATSLAAGTRTWDGKYDTAQIEVRVVYFVPSDRAPLRDWKERAAYYCRRIELFHKREFQKQSTLEVTLHPEPLVSELTTAELRRGDADAIYHRTLNETANRLNFPGDRSEAFPILLVLSEINWRPLDDFYRLKPQDGKFVFEGSYNRGEHFPGATSGGARAAYLRDRGVGWGLVSADGWRVPYRGSDCVIYHEGVGHTVGLPHPEPGNGSVMSLGQYRGWLSESWLDKEQKIRLQWDPELPSEEPDPHIELFSNFRAIPEPRVPQPGEAVTLSLDWPENANVKSLRVRFQTSIEGPWIESPQQLNNDTPERANLGTFDRPTPVSYRVDAELDSGATVELWGYLQIRQHPREHPLPYALSPDLISAGADSPDEAVIAELPADEVDLFPLIDPETCWQTGEWARENGKLVSPKKYGARIEIPFSPPEEYRLALIAEPLDEPNGLILGQRSGENRFLTLLNYSVEGNSLSALENVDGRNVGNDTTFRGQLLKKDRLSQIIVEVRKNSVTVSVDGRTMIRWKGKSDALGLSDYWKTPDERALFLGSYDCSYRFHRITLEALTGTGTVLQPE